MPPRPESSAAREALKRIVTSRLARVVAVEHRARVMGYVTRARSRSRNASRARIAVDLSRVAREGVARTPRVGPARRSNVRWNAADARETAGARGVRGRKRA